MKFDEDGLLGKLIVRALNVQDWRCCYHFILLIVVGTLKLFMWKIRKWSLTSLQQRLVKTGGRLIEHARYYWLMLAESHLTKRLLGSMVRRIDALAVAAG
jgi:hypothetical protein